MPNLPRPIPRFYPILDAELAGSRLLHIASSFADAGVELLQIRDKSGSSHRLHSACVELLNLFRSRANKKIRLIVNDRADLAALSGAPGVHLGQEDISVDAARTVLNAASGPPQERRRDMASRPEKWIGLSTHNLPQLRAAARTSADYVAIGPIFSTASKKNPDPVVGLDFIARARRLTRKPLVAIGGITLENVKSVWRAGADSVAVISDVISAPDPAARAVQYLKLAAEFAALSAG